MEAELHRTLDTLWRMESPGLIASLARRLGDLGRAEELVQDAWVAALEHWPVHGIPRNPAASLATTARNPGIAAPRHRSLARQRLDPLPAQPAPAPPSAPHARYELER